MRFQYPSLRLPTVLRATAFIILVTLPALATVSAEPAAAAALTAQQIVEKSVAARGGLDAWRKLETMAWAGHLESERMPTGRMPFEFLQKRPNKSRFEIAAPGQHSLRVFNGTQGWKMRPGPDGAPQVQPFTPDETKFARESPGFDGPLVDYEAKGNRIELVGSEALDGRKAYRLRVTPRAGNRLDIWIDAETFLELRYDRTSYSKGGEAGVVSVYYRDYKTVEGLQIPSVVEIGSIPGKKPDRMVIEKVALNPSIDDRTFSGAGPPPRRATVTVGPGPGQTPTPAPASN